MNPTRFDLLAEAISNAPSRRALLAGLTSGLLTTALRAPGDVLAAKKKVKKKGGKKKGKKKGPPCKAPNCIQAPFRIEAVWDNADDDHDTNLYVPNLPGGSLPKPFIDIFCTPESLSFGEVYPFAYLNQDATGPGDEVITVKRLLDGRYEYWLQLGQGTQAATVSVQLVKNGKIRQVWSNPANPSPGDDQWLVFAIIVEGGKGTVRTIDQFPVEFPPPAEETRVCPE